MKTSIFFSLAALFLVVHANGQGFTVIQNGPDLHVARYGHATVGLPNGNVLVIGGHTTGFNLTPTAEVYDAASNTWTLHTLQNNHDMIALAELNNGNWLFMGGCSSAYGVGQSNVTTLYNPTTNTFTNGPLMQRARTNSSAVKLANGDVLLVGNWYAIADAEYYDHVSGTFVTTGNVLTERSHAVVFPCPDTTAVVFGGYTPYGGALSGTVELYDHSTGQFSVFAPELFAGETGWVAAWNAMYPPIEEMRLSTGEYVFLTYKSVGSTNTYRIGLFDPVTKSFSLLQTSPELPIYDATSTNPYAIWGNIFVDPTQDFIYLNAHNGVSGYHEEIIYTIDVPNALLSIPSGSMTFNHFVSSGSKAWVNGSIMYTGGTVDGSNFNVSDKVTVLQPNNSFGMAEERQRVSPIQLYPNPTKNAQLHIASQEQGIDAIQIFDFAGRMLWQNSYANQPQQVTVALPQLPAGMYILTTTVQNKRYSTRFVNQ